MKFTEAEFIYSTVRVPLVLIVLAFALYASTLYGSWAWFSFHPFITIVASFILVPLAVLKKKIGGVQNTKLHGNMLLAALLLVYMGFYVIYSNKSMLSKLHFQSTHSYLGVASILSFSSSALGFFSLHPTYGLFKTDKRIRQVHKWSGKITVILLWFTCFMGFENVELVWWRQLLFGACILFLSSITLL